MRFIKESGWENQDSAMRENQDSAIRENPTY